MVAERVRFICRGGPVPNHMTPLTFDFPKEEMVHVVLSKVRRLCSSVPLAPHSLKSLSQVCHCVCAPLYFFALELLPPGPPPLKFVVRLFTQPRLEEVMTRERLVANCRFCEKAGSQFEYHPICGRCLCVTASVCGSDHACMCTHTHACVRCDPLFIPSL